MKWLTILILTIFLITYPDIVLAHAGVFKRSGNTLITIYQNPISPLVGEEVKFTFAITDLDYNRIENLDLKLTLIDTYYGGESKDRIILTKQFKTDANGVFEFKYTFNEQNSFGEKENYFNIDLSFRDKDGKDQQIDFLVQPRDSNEQIQNTPLMFFLWMLIAFSIGSFSSFLVLRKYKRNWISLKSSKNRK